MSQSGIKKGIAYYHCQHRAGCGKYCEQTDLEGQVAEKFRDLQFSDEFINLVIDKAKRIYYDKRKTYEGRRQGLTNRKTALEGKRKVAEDKLLEGVMKDEDFTRIRTDIATQLQQIEDELISLEEQREVDIDIAQEVLLLTRDIYRAYTKASFDLKRQYLGFFWERFDVADGVILKAVSSPLFEQLLKAEQAYFRSSKKLLKSKEALNTKDSEKVILSDLLLRG